MQNSLCTVPKHEDVTGAKFVFRRYLGASCLLHVLVVVPSRESPFYLSVSSPLVMQMVLNAAGHEKSLFPFLESNPESPVARRIAWSF